MKIEENIIVTKAGIEQIPCMNTRLWLKFNRNGKKREVSIIGMTEEVKMDPQALRPLGRALINLAVQLAAEGEDA